MSWRNILKEDYPKDYYGVKLPFDYKLQGPQKDKELQTAVQEYRESVKKLQRLLTKQHTGMLKPNDVDKHFEELDAVMDKIKESVKYIEGVEKGTFEKGAGGVSFGGHGTNPELFNIRYGKKRRKKDGKEVR